MSIDWSRATVLDVAEFDVVREQLDLGPAPAVLELTSPGATDVERARVVRTALEGLRRRGLVTAGRVRADLAEALRTLVSAELRHELLAAEPYPQRALIATRRDTAVLAVRIDDEVALVPVDPRRAPAALVALLGPIVPGPGPAARIPFRVLLDALDACGGDRERLGAELRRRGCTGAEAGLVERMADLHALAEVGTVRGGRRASSFLLVLGTPHGHYYQRRPRPARLGGPPSPDAVVAAGPLDPATLLGELRTPADHPVGAGGPAVRRG